MDWPVWPPALCRLAPSARNLLVKELAIAKSYSEEKIMEELRTIFAN